MTETWSIRGDPTSRQFTVTSGPDPIFSVYAILGHDDLIKARVAMMVAAPDLLAALKDALRSSRKDFKSGPDGDRQHREAYAEQFAALSKARGA